MNFTGESIVYYLVKGFGALVRLLPVESALRVGRALGMTAYFFNTKHRRLAYNNLKIAFASTKSPQEIKEITKHVFQNFGQNFIELLRLPLLTPALFEKYVTVEGKGHVKEALQQGQGVILLAMHYGSWELASMLGHSLGHPYKVLVKPQTKFSKLDELLNSYRQCCGSVVLERGMGTRDFLKSLKENAVIGLVVDQGGRDGVLVPFFGRQASMSVGAVRVGLKLGVPVCFSIIIRENGPHHRLIINKPLTLEKTGDPDQDVKLNLQKIAALMEQYIRENPAGYVWFYKIWKYSNDAVTMILNEGTTGHLRQSQAVANLLIRGLAERKITSRLETFDVVYKSEWAERLMMIFSALPGVFPRRTRLKFVKWCLSRDSFRKLMSVKPDFIISCGSAAAPLNVLLSREHDCKSIVVLKPGMIATGKFDVVILPQHDGGISRNANIVVTRGAPNLITPEYLDGQKEALLSRFSHLKSGDNFRIGLLLGGDTRNFVLTEQRVKVVAHQIKEIAEEISADILITTSRRTSVKVENLLQREFKKHARCRFLVLANRDNVPEAVGGILGLSDIVVVSGDSVSMISEAASSGKKVVVFPVENRSLLASEKSKHNQFVEQLNTRGYILSSDVRNIKQSLYNLIKNKIQTRRLDDNETILEGLRQIL